MDFHVFDGKFQGSRSHLIGLYGEMTRLCPEFDFVFFLEKTDALGQLPGFDAPNVERVFMPHASPLKRLFWHLPRLRRAHRIDLLHTQYVIPLVPARGNAVTVHDVLFESFPEYFTPLFVLRSRLMMRWSARRAELAFTVSEYSRGEIAARYGVPRDKIGVTHNAVDRAVFFPGNAGEDAVRARGLVPGEYLLTVGRIEPRKNHAGILKAYKSLPGNPPPLVIVGQRDFGYGAFEAEMADLPANRVVHIFSDVSDTELPALYRHARIFLYPSFAEGFGMPPLEAMACGAPVVTSRSTAITEVVADAALLVDPHNAAEIAAATSTLLDDPARALAMRAQGLARAEAFTWRASAECLAGRFRSFLAAGRPGAVS